MHKAPFKRLEDIEVWQMARKIAVPVLRMCNKPPISRDFAFRDQLWRATLSISCNIAEGYGRRSDVEFARYLDIARGSTTEVLSILYIGVDVGYLDQATFTALAGQLSSIGGRVSGLSQYLRKEHTQCT